MKSAEMSTDGHIDLNATGAYCHNLAQRLYPICRSLTGPGVRQTLEILQQEIAGLGVHAIPSGTQAFDWVVPDEWTIRDAFVADEAGHRVIDFQAHNLHVVGYSHAVDDWFDWEELDQHLYSLPNQPHAIPYITSYYARRWGFCLAHEVRQTLRPGRYRVVIDADLKPGVLNYAECLLPGDTAQEVLLSTYVCHPSMANNELSGPVVTTALLRWLSSLPRRRYSYRAVFIPETIGSVVYISRNLPQLKQQVIAGYNITCVGDDRCFSFLPSRAGNTLSDKAAMHVLQHIDPSYKRYGWLDRGSDERQYCAPGVDLPIATIMRSKYAEYPEYHTSLDDLSLVTPSGLAGAFNALRLSIEAIELDVRPRITVMCEPQLGKRGLYPSLSTKASGDQVRAMMDMLSYCDGQHSLIDIGIKIGVPIQQLAKLLEPIIASGLVRVDDHDSPMVIPSSTPIDQTQSG